MPLSPYGGWGDKKLRICIHIFTKEEYLFKCDKVYQLTFSFIMQDCLIMNKPQFYKQEVG